MKPPNPPVVDYGGNYDEWSVACPDGAVWPDVASSQAEVEGWLTTADEACGCEQSPHVIVWREVPEWELVPSAHSREVES